MACGPRALRIAALRDAIDVFWLQPDRNAIAGLRAALRASFDATPHETLADVFARIHEPRYRALIAAVEAATFAPR